MKALPEGFETGTLFGSLAEGWDFDVESADYAAVGAGSYHWVVRAGDGTRAFATVDDLDQKSWLGEGRDSRFDGLRSCFDTAAALRDAGLVFVVAPIPTSRGESVVRVEPRHTVALFPFVDGRAGEWGPFAADERDAVLSMLAELHRATPGVASVAHIVGLELPGRAHIETALGDVDEPWSGGPFSEPARRALADRAADVAELLALADRLAAAVEARGDEWVVTHGEPHAGNVMRSGERRLLVDWDTVALAPPERDLWLPIDDAEGELAAAYADATGRAVDPTALEFFRRLWDLKDLAEWLNVLRAPHTENADTTRQLGGLRRVVAAP